MILTPSPTPFPAPSPVNLPIAVQTLAQQLTEATSIAQFQALQAIEVATSVTTAPVQTTYIQAGVQAGVQAGETTRAASNSPAPLLFIHGFDSSVMEFRRLQPLLAKTSETWAIDLLGFGFSDRQVAPSINPTAIDTHLYAFWQTAIQRPVVLVGASMGGAAAINFALRHPEAVDRLILLDSAGIANGPVIGKFLFPPLDFWAADFLRRPNIRNSISASAYYDKHLNSEDARCCAALHLEMPNWHQALMSFTKSGGYPSLRRQLSQLKISTLVIWGKNDQILGTKDPAIFAQLIPESKVIWIENCGHVPHLEAPAETAQAILNFIHRNVYE